MISMPKEVWMAGIIMTWRAEGTGVITRTENITFSINRCLMMRLLKAPVKIDIFSPKNKGIAFVLYAK